MTLTGVCDNSAEAVGRIKATTVTKSRRFIVRTTVTLKNCSEHLNPPKKNAMPVLSRFVVRILPMIEVFKVGTCPLLKRRIDVTNNTRLLYSLAKKREQAKQRVELPKAHVYQYASNGASSESYFINCQSEDAVQWKYCSKVDEKDGNGIGIHIIYHETCRYSK